MSPIDVRTDNYLIAIMNSMINWASLPRNICQDPLHVVSEIISKSYPVSDSASGFMDHIYIYPTS